MRKNFVMEAVLTLGLSTTLASCGNVSTTDTTSFEVRMVGSLTAPLGADGVSSPLSQTYLFKGITLVPSAGGDNVELYTDDPISFRIINRPQVIYEKPDMTDYVGQTFSSATIKFDSIIVVATAKSSENLIQLDTEEIKFNEVLTVTEGKDQKINIQVLWGKTVKPDPENAAAAEIISSPSFSMTLGSLDK